MRSRIRLRSSSGQRATHMKNSPTLRGRRVEGFGQAAKTDAFTRSLSMVSINCFIERPKRSSFHTTSVSPLRANSNAARKGAIRFCARQLLGENPPASRFGERLSPQGKIPVNF
jgi:hypothetical protein